MADARSDTRAHDRSSRSSAPPEAISSDIAATRERMDRTMAALRDRLSTEEFADTAGRVIRDLVEGRPNRIADTIHANPIPIAMIGIGLAWIALSIGRDRPTRRRADRQGASGASRADRDPKTRMIPLRALAEDARSGSESLRRAAAALSDTAAASPLRDGVQLFERTAEALQPAVPVSTAKTNATDPWQRIDRITPGHDLGKAMADLEERLDHSLALTRSALSHQLGDTVRAAIASHLRDLESLHDRVKALRDQRR